MTLLETYQTYIKIPPQITYFYSSSIPINISLFPDIYYVNLTFLSNIINQSFILQIYLPPSLDDYRLLLEKITSLRMLIEENYENLRLPQSIVFRSILKRLQETYRESLTLFLEDKKRNATILYHKANVLYSNLKKNYMSNISKISFNYIYLKNLDNYLLLDPKVILVFWSRILITTLIIPILIFVFLPLYATRIDIWLVNLADIIEKIGKNMDLYKSTINDRINALLTLSQSSITPSFRFNLLLISAAFISTIGLLTNNIITIIGSMLVSPILSIAVGTAIGLAFKDEKIDDVTGSYIFWKGIKSEIYTVTLTIITSFITTKIISTVYPIIVTQQIIISSRPNLSDLGIAIGAGFAGSLAFLTLKKESTAIIGAAMALAFIPPAANIGISLVIQRLDMTLGSLSLLIVNIIALTSSVYLTARIYVLEPLLSDFTKVIYLNFKESILNLNPKHFINTLSSLIISWINIILNISPLHNKGEGSLIPYIKYILIYLFKYLFIPLTFVFITVFILTTNIFYPITFIFKTFETYLSNIVNKEMLLEKYGRFLSYLLGLLIILWLIYSFKISKKKQNLRTIIFYIGYSILIWSFIEYIYELYLFSRAHTLIFLIYFLTIAIIIYWNKINNKARAIAMGFTVFSLLFIIFQSAYVYQSIIYSQNLVNISNTAKYVVSTYLNLSPDLITVKSSISHSRPILTIGIKVPINNIGTFKLNNIDIKIISQSIRELTGWDELIINFHYILIP